MRHHATAECVVGNALLGRGGIGRDEDEVATDCRGRVVFVLMRRLLKSGGRRHGRRTSVRELVESLDRRDLAALVCRPGATHEAVDLGVPMG
jgi:hypothetical protein